MSKIKLDLTLEITDEKQLERARRVVGQIARREESKEGDCYLINDGVVVLTPESVVASNVPSQVIDDLSRAIYDNIVRVVPLEEKLRYVLGGVS